MEIKKTEAHELIFVPVPGTGHLVSTLEFAKCLIDRDDRISITILLIRFKYASFVDAYIKSLASQSRIKFINLPDVDPPPQDLVEKSVEVFVCAIMESYVPHVKHALNNILLGSVRVVGLVFDFFCESMIDVVAKEFSIPSYIFVTSNAGFVELMFYLPTRHEKIGSIFEESEPDIVMPGFKNPVPVSVLPDAVFNTEGGYDSYVKIAKPFKNVKGIIVNTFTELEKYAIDSFLNSEKLPKVYPVGPIIQLKGLPTPDSDIDKRDNIVKWLDEQPDSSVVFLCFGSMGIFDPPQVKEIAEALDGSALKFLLSIRLPPPNVIEECLPKGFLDQPKGRGMICSWASQVEVIGHKAVGGFVSHCGWNSILESLWCGVPIATWPMYAEQQMNAFRMVKELELAVELRLDYRKNSEIVKADEIEKAIRCLMDIDNPVRGKVKNMSEMAKNALREGGSSFNYIGKLIDDLISTGSGGESS